MNQRIVEFEDVHFRYLNKHVLKGANFHLSGGTVCALCGENGVGKTTLVKLILGRLTPQSGSVRVFGHSPVSNPEAVLGKIGYVSEDRDMPHWMNVAELVAYIRAFYPNWDDQYAAELQNQFALSDDDVIGNLSRGQRARANLLIALAHRPPLLLLDEPSAGLDAVVRRDIVHAVMRVAADEGRSVLFSSHLLEELQQVSDRVLLLKNGVIKIDETTEQFVNAHFFVRADFPDTTDGDWSQFVVLSKNPLSSNVDFVVGESDIDSLRFQISESGGRIVQQRNASLEEMFVALTRQAGSTDHAS